MSSAFRNLLKTVQELTLEESKVLFHEHSKKLSSLRRNLKIEFLTSLNLQQIDILLDECEEYSSLIKNGEIWIELIRHHFGIDKPVSIFGYAGCENESFHVYKMIKEADSLSDDENKWGKLIISKNLVGLRYLVEVLDDLDSNIFPKVVDKAVRSEFAPGVVMLLDDRNEDVSQSLISALEIKNYTLCRILVERGVDIDVYNDKGLSPILIACSDTSPEIPNLVTRFIDLNADVDDYDKNNRTPLIYAALNNNIKVVKLLLEEGADPEIADNSGMRAIDYAELNEYHDIIKILE